MKESIFKSFLRFLFPPKCVNCGRIIGDDGSDDILCGDCHNAFLREKLEKCTKCGRTYDVCFCSPDGFLPETIIYALPYDKVLPVSRGIVLSVKRRRNTPATVFLARTIVRKAERLGGIPDDAVVTFVPRSPEKKRKYGTDQAEELAEAICKAAGIEKPLILLRHISFSSEQKKLGASGRAENARRSFRETEYAAKAAGRCVLLVDDIVTTGATVNACTEIIKRSGATRVICLAAARRDDHGRQRAEGTLETSSDESEILQ